MIYATNYGSNPTLFQGYSKSFAQILFYWHLLLNYLFCGDSYEKCYVNKDGFDFDLRTH